MGGLAVQPSKIPFNKPYLTGKEMDYIAQVFQTRSFAGNGEFSKNAPSGWKKQQGVKKLFWFHPVLLPSK